MQLDWLELMKNKIKFFLLIIIFFTPINKIYSDEIKFEANFLTRVTALPKPTEFIPSSLVIIINGSLCVLIIS